MQWTGHQRIPNVKTAMFEEVRNACNLRNAVKNTCSSKHLFFSAEFTFLGSLQMLLGNVWGRGRFVPATVSPHC
jgi:hypothetical protein